MVSVKSSASATPLAPVAIKRPPVAPKPNVSSPPALSPAADSPTPPRQLSTSKVWVVPPRPKPGRKPAADAPQNKRKAQNRAAQRAFRERKAQALGDMEEQINKMRMDMEAREAQLEARLQNIQVENANLKRKLSEVEATQVLAASRAQNQGSMSSSPSFYQVASPASSAHGSPYVDLLDRVLDEKLPVSDQDDKCVVCTKEQCLCEDVGLRERKRSRASSIASTGSSAGRRTSEQYVSYHFQPQYHRHSHDHTKQATAQAVPQEQEQEIDFTAMFSKPAPLPKNRTVGPTVSLKRGNRSHKLNTVPSQTASVYTAKTETVFRSSSVEPQDRCGFCVEGAPCLCAEAAGDNDSRECSSGQGLDDNLENVKLPPLQMGSPLASQSHYDKLPALHADGMPEVASPPPSSPSFPLSPRSVPAVISSSTEVTVASSGSSLKNDAECTGDPGTCMQCQTDPMSTLFCSTVANKTPVRPGLPSSEQGKTYIPCSVAYRTLSRHKDFKSADLSNLIGKLNTRGMQVEVNSVANVLRELDRKLYS